MMNLYKFIDVTDMPDGHIPLIVISAQGENCRCHVDERLITSLKKKSLTNRVAVVKELLATLEQAMLTYTVDDN